MSFEDLESTETAILEAIGEAILVVDDGGTIVYQRPAVGDAFGYAEDALVGTDATDLVHDQHRSAVEGLLADLEAGEIERVEWRIRDAEGAWRWAEVSITESASSAIEGYVVSLRDVTEEIHARWDRERLLDRMTEGFFAVDTDGQVTHVNDRAAEMLEVDPESAVGTVLEELFPEDVGSRFADEYTEAMETGEATTFEAYYEPLETWFHAAAYPGETGLSVFLEDVTERKRTEMAMAKNEKALRELHDVAADKSLDFEEKLVRLLDLGRERLDLRLGFLTRIEAAEDGALLADGEEAGDGMVQRVIACRGDHELLVRGESCPLSDAYCKRTIETDELMATRNPTEEWVQPSAYDTFGLETYVGGKLIVDDEIYGTLCFADTEVREEPFRSDEEAFVEVLVEWMAYELERERREEHLERQNDRLEAFASMVSHDLRNPLTIAQGNLDLLEVSADSEEFEAVAESLDRMERLIDGMLWLAREGRDVASMEPVELADVASEAWGFVATQGATIDLDCEDRTVDADRDRLVQLLENLFRNAIDHSDGDVTVRVGVLEDGFFVEDDGSGIPEAEHDSVFETGFTTDAEGTGFGLAIVQRIAEAHGWDVAIEEGADGGARFAFRRS